MNFSEGLTTALLGAAVVIVQPQMAAALTVNQIQTIAQEITVLIQGPAAPGSGVLIGKEGKTYYVLTARHVVENIGAGDEVDVTTHDGKVHSIDISKIQKLSDDVDLAVIEFTSDRNYRLATLSNFNYRLYKNREYPSNGAYGVPQSLAQPEKAFVFLSGWPAVWENDRQSLRFNPGILFSNAAAAISNPLVGSQGYELVYTNLSHPGMSGGPVLDTQGRLIGIHGRADGKQISEDDRIVGQFLEEAGSVRVKVGLSLGIPIDTFLQWALLRGMELKLRVENSPPVQLSRQEIASWEPPVAIEDDSNPLYWIDRGNQLWRLKRISEAVAAFDRAIELKPDFFIAWFAKGFALGFNQQYQEALTACNRATKLKPDYYDAWRCKAGALQELQRFDAALIALNKALKINPNNSADWATQGELRLALKQYRGALESFDKAIEMRKKQGLPQSAWILNNRGFVLLVMQQYLEALSFFERAITIDPNYPPVWNNKGWALSGLNRDEESLEAYEKAVELNPKFVNAWNNRGMTLYEMGRYQEALTSFERAIEIDPNYKPAIENRDALLRQMER
ncbi:MAG: tetratricopeptide repeat protein [Xenococcaceae cyanobacterium]